MHFRILLFILILPLVLLFQGCKFISEGNVTIKGVFTHMPETQLYIYQLLPASKPLIDSVSTDASGKFSISIDVEKAGFYTLRHDADNEITLVISPGDEILVAGDGKSMRKTYTVEGSEDSKLYAGYDNFTSANLHKVDSLSQIFTESRNQNDFIALKNRLDSAYLQIFENQRAKVIAFVNAHPNSLASLLVILNNFGPNTLLSEQTQPDLFLKLDSALILTYPDNSLVNTFHLRMISFKAETAERKEHDENLKPGKPAPEIILLSSTGKEIKLTSLKGKVTLLYFWSSWNALCRQTNMNLTGLYTKFHSAGFEIYAVSLDSDPDLWQKAYMLDKAYWLQVNDPRGLESEYCKTYDVRAIPKMILIGKDGNIIASDPVFGELGGLIQRNL